VLAVKWTASGRMKWPPALSAWSEALLVSVVQNSHMLCRVGLAQLVRFLVVELTHPCLNPRFDMGVAFTANYSFSGRRRPRRQRDALDDRLRKSQDQAGSVFRRCS
jgi:hypothetical protein